MQHDRPRLRRREASEYLSEIHGMTVAVATLAKLASVGGGPAMRYHGRIPLSDRQELDRWADSRLSGPVAKTQRREAHHAP